MQLPSDEIATLADAASKAETIDELSSVLSELDSLDGDEERERLQAEEGRRLHSVEMFMEGLTQQAWADEYDQVAVMEAYIKARQCLQVIEDKLTDTDFVIHGPWGDFSVREISVRARETPEGRERLACLVEDLRAVRQHALRRRRSFRADRERELRRRCHLGMVDRRAPITRVIASVRQRGSSRQARPVRRVSASARARARPADEPPPEPDPLGRPRNGRAV